MEVALKSHDKFQTGDLIGLTIFLNMLTQQNQEFIIRPLFGLVLVRVRLRYQYILQHSLFSLCMVLFCMHFINMHVLYGKC